MHYIVITFLALLLFMNAGTAYAEKQLSAQIYGSHPSKSLFAISPSGKRLAYRDKVGGEDKLVVIDYQNHQSLGSINLENIEPYNLFFIDENRVLLIVSSHMHLTGYVGRYDVSAAYSYNIENNHLNQLLIPGKGISKGQANLGRVFGISKDKQHLFMPALSKADEYHLYKVNINKRGNPRIYVKGTYDTRRFFLGENNQVVARERYDVDSTIHAIETFDGEAWHKIFSEDVKYPTKYFSGISPDFKKLIFKASNSKSERIDYYTMALADGKIEGPYFKHDDKDVEQVITNLNQVVQGVRYSGFFPKYEFFNPNVDQLINSITASFPENSLWIQAQTPDWSQIIFYMDGKNSSGDYLLFKKGQLGRIAPARPAITPEKVNNVKVVSFSARDGLSIPTLVTLPSEYKGIPLPAIIMPHGGPESYDKAGFDYMTQYFSNMGFVVIQPQFRGSTGFGNSHRVAGHGEWGKKMQDDLTDAVKYFANEKLIDDKRVCIVGASYGGYAALAGVSFTPDLYKCAVSINGVSDVKELMDDEKRDVGLEHPIISYWEDVIGRGELNKSHLKSISPIRYIENINAPVLLVHGERDAVVSVDQSKGMYSEMKSEDKIVQYVELEDGGHHLTKESNRIKALEVIGRFLRKYI